MPGQYYSPESISRLQGIEITNLRAEIRALRGALDLANHDRQKAQDELAEHTRKLTAAQSRMQIALDRRELYLGEQFSDDKIRGEFLRLRGLMKQISTYFLDAVPDPESSEAAVLSLYGRYKNELQVEQLRAIMLDRRQRRLRRGIIRGSIAHRTFMYATRLQKSSSTSDSWLAPELANALAQLEDRLSQKMSSSTLNKKLSTKTITTEEVNEWRARTCFLLQKVVPPDVDDRILLRLARSIVADILPWAPMNMADAIIQKTMILVRGVIAFSQQLRRQRAHWTVWTGEAISVPHWSWMQDENADDYDERTPTNFNSNARVLSLFPALVKRGNDLGEMYSEETCIEKAQVHTFGPQLRSRESAQESQAGRSGLNKRAMNGAHVSVQRVPAVNDDHFKEVSSNSIVGYNGAGRVYQDTQIPAHTRAESSSSASLPVQPSKASRTDQSLSSTGRHVENGDQIRKQIYQVPSDTKTSTMTPQPSYPYPQNTGSRGAQPLAYKDGNVRRSIDPGINPGNARRSVDHSQPDSTSMPGALTKSSSTFQQSSQARPWYKGGFLRSSSKSSTNRQGSGPSESSITATSGSRPRAESFDANSRQGGYNR